MKDILECCCGLDIHKDTIVACLLEGPVNIQPTSESRTFSTLITMLKTDSTFNEQCFEIRKAKSERKRVSRMIHELAQLGYEVRSTQS